MRRALVAGNWKMHGSLAESGRLVDELLRLGAGAGGAEVIVCPPFVYLPAVAARLQGTPLGLGAQNVCAESVGAYTGEVAATMLAEIGCRYVIVGHSERRALYAEDDALVARKFVAAGRHGLIPILCVGETLAEREAGSTAAVVTRQLDAVLEAAGAGAFAAAVVAYEPVWAIGTGRTATSAQAQEVHAFIRRQLAAMFDDSVARRVRIQYGGSVKPANARELMSQPDVDGALVGGASLAVRDFSDIVKNSISEQPTS